MVKARSLQDLAAIKAKLVADAEQAAALEAAKLKAQRRANAEKTLFVRAVGIGVRSQLINWDLTPIKCELMRRALQSVAHTVPGRPNGGCFNPNLLRARGV